MTLDFNALRGMNPQDMIRSLESMRQQVERQLAAFETERDRIAAITVTCTDPEGRVTVTIGHDGYLTDLAIAPEIAAPGYRMLGPVIIATLNEARAQLEERLNEIRLHWGATGGA